MEVAEHNVAKSVKFRFWTFTACYTKAVAQAVLFIVFEERVRSKSSATNNVEVSAVLVSDGIPRR